jgi:excisionase family DNA binding protein
VTLAQSIVAAIADDPVALAELRAVIGVASLMALDAAPLAYTAATLADDLGVSTKTVRGAISRGELEAVKRSSRWLISAEAVRAWTDGERRPTARPRRTDGVKRSRVGGPSLRTVLCDLPADSHPQNSKEGR